MGNTLVFHASLRNEMSLYQTLPLSHLKRLPTRFAAINKAWGYGVNKDKFLVLFRELLKNNNVYKDDRVLEEQWKIWDNDNNNITDILEIICSLYLVCDGKFEDKIDACFNLFDFDDNHCLSSDEFTIMCNASLCGLSKIVHDGSHLLALQNHTISQRAFQILQTCAVESTHAHAANNNNNNNSSSHASHISRQLFHTLIISSPSLLKFLCKFGTRDGEAMKKKYVEWSEKDKAALKIQHAFKHANLLSRALSTPNQNNHHSNATSTSSSSTQPRPSTSHGTTSSSSSSAPISSKVGSIRKNDDPAMKTFDFNLHTIRRAKFIFDHIDRDHSGSISISELSASMQGHEFAGTALQAFRALDADGNGTISFDEVLHVLYPHARKDDIKSMMKQVEVKQFSRDAVDRLRDAFEEIDEDFDGKNKIKAMYDYMKNSDYFRDYLRDYEYVPQKDRLCTLQELIKEMFSVSHYFQLSQILQWVNSNSIHSLSEEQQKELEQLFYMYDTNNDNIIDMKELKNHFKSLGFSQDEVLKLFSKYDKDGNNNIDMQEFKRFYRSVWDTSTRHGEHALHINTSD